MPDISMCLNCSCPSITNCYRFMAKPSEYRQAYSNFQPEEGKDKCGEYIPISKKETPNGALI